MRITYEIAKKDWNFLNDMCPGGDCMEVDASVFELMANPTKKLAKELYISAIEAWFAAIGRYTGDGGVDIEVLQDAEVIALADKYGCSLAKFL